MGAWGMRLLLAIAMTAALAVSGAACAADKIALVCSGTMGSLGYLEKSPVGATSIIIDLDQGVVTMPTGDYRITKVTENHINFEGALGRQKVNGNIDRLAGTVGWSLESNNTRADGVTLFIGG
jgi:hypothetical protein